MAAYHHRPRPGGLHAKLLAELSTGSPYTIRPDYAGEPNSIRVYVLMFAQETLLWRGHRDAMPAHYRGAADPYRCLSRPASD